MSSDEQQSSASEPTDTGSPNTGKGTSIGKWVGGAFGVAAVVVIIGLILYFLVFKDSDKATQEPGSACDDDDVCKSGNCSWDFAGDGQTMVCCKDAETSLYATVTYCANIEDGKGCYSDDMCSSGWCQGNDGGLSLGTCTKRAIEGEACATDGYDGSCAEGLECCWQDASADSIYVCGKNCVTCLGAQYQTNQPAGTSCRCDSVCASDDCDGDGGIGLRGTCV
jgi:hypothetical protein